MKGHIHISDIGSDEDKISIRKLTGWFSLSCTIEFKMQKSTIGIELTTDDLRNLQTEIINYLNEHEKEENS